MVLAKNLVCFSYYPAQLLGHFNDCFVKSFLAKVIGKYVSRIVSSVLFQVAPRIP